MNRSFSKNKSIVAAVLILLTSAADTNAGSSISIGSACLDSSFKKSPNPSENVLKMARKLREFLENHVERIAIVSRVGSDLSTRKWQNPEKQKYTHAGLAIKDLKTNEWRFVHLLNTCEGPGSDIYEQSLHEFFMDDPFMYDITVGAPSLELQNRIAAVLEDRSIGPRGLAVQLHQAAYSKVANPFALDYQNSNMWLLAVIAAAQSGVTERDLAQRYYKENGFSPTQTWISPSEKLLKSIDRFLGNTFLPNFKIDDHTPEEIASGWYNLVSATSLYDYIRRTDRLPIEQEICPDSGCNLPVKNH